MSRSERQVFSQAENRNDEVEKIEDAFEHAVDFSCDTVRKIDKAVEAVKDKQLKEKSNKLAGKFKEAIFFYTKLIVLGGLVHGTQDISAASVHDSFSSKVERAKREMRENGITREHAIAYMPVISDVLYESITPIGYKGEGKKLKGLWENIAKGREKFWPRREDAWRLYLGLPQIYNTFGISDYRPSKRKNEEMYYFKLNGQFQGLTHYDPLEIKAIVHALDRSDQNRKDVGRWSSLPSYGDASIMGTYQINAGEDERGHYISYWDLWNLDVGIEANGFLGKPFEIYDRLYYDPKTFEVIGDKDPLPTYPEQTSDII